MKGLSGPDMVARHYKLSELARLTKTRLSGRGDPLIGGAAGFAVAGARQITFVDDKTLVGRLGECGAAAIILHPDVVFAGPALRAPDPRSAYATILGLFATPLDRVFPPGIHQTASIHPEADLGKAVAVGAYSVIGAGVRIGNGTRLGAGVVIEPDACIGDNSLLYSRVVIRERCQIGRDCILYPGAIIGSDGFGYHSGSDGLLRIPQIGIVVLEDRVDIGANSCVDRATTGETRIATGSKIDNLVQIGHNVSIGRNCTFSGQSGVSGSTTLGDNVVVGGQTGIGDHLEIGRNVKVAAKTGVVRDIPDGQSVYGYPAVEFKRAYRIVAHMHRLPELAKRVQRLERFIGRKTEKKD